jgi:hypothetical protein
MEIISYHIIRLLKLQNRFHNIHAVETLFCDQFWLNLGRDIL